jgi:hypothetical protein
MAYDRAEVSQPMHGLDASLKVRQLIEDGLDVGGYFIHVDCYHRPMIDGD